MKLRTLTLPAAALVAGLTLTSCGSDNAADAPAPTPTAAASSTGSPAAQQAALTVSDPWVKAATSGMSAVFGTLTNSGSTDLTVVSASTPSAASIEIHETTTDSNGASSMREKEGGLVIPAGKSVTLAPGGDHLMLMGISQAIVAGAPMEVTLTLSDGSKVTFAALGKEYAGAKETYAPETATDDHGDEGHGDDDGHSHEGDHAH